MPQFYDRFPAEETSSTASRYIEQAHGSPTYQPRPASGWTTANVCPSGIFTSAKWTLDIAMRASTLRSPAGISREPVSFGSPAANWTLDIAGLLRRLRPEFQREPPQWDGLRPFQLTGAPFPGQLCARMRFSLSKRSWAKRTQRPSPAGSADVS